MCNTMNYVKYITEVICKITKQNVKEKYVSIYGQITAYILQNICHYNFFTV